MKLEMPASCVRCGTTTEYGEVLDGAVECARCLLHAALEKALTPRVRRPAMRRTTSETLLYQESELVEQED